MLGSIAFIPDGNRRYASHANVSLVEAYKLGTEKAWDVLSWIAAYPMIKAGTFYTLSLENLARKGHERAILFRIFEKELESVKDRPVLRDNGIKLRFLGRRDVFPQAIRNKMSEAEELTEDNGKRTINLALGYNGQSEIVDAAKKFAQSCRLGEVSPNDLTEEKFRNYLYGNFPDPDLIVRTSGTKRLSGFLTYQSAYSELCFVDKYWPELQKSDLNKIVKDFEERERRFGK